MLTRVIRVTIYATATVLAAFHVRAGIGQSLLGRFIDKREDALRVYAVLEFFVACAALWFRSSSLHPFICSDTPTRSAAG